MTIPDSVTTIGAYAFDGNSLTSVTIPSGVTYVGSFAFYQNNLASVSLPDSLTSIGQYVFAENDLTSVAIPGTVTSIGYAAFFRNAITSVTIPASVNYIDVAAFRNNSLSTLTFSGPVATVAGDAFSYQTGASGAGSWFTTSGGSSSGSAVPSPVPGATTFYSSADALPSVTVTFDSNGGSAVTDQTVVEGWAAEEPTDPTRDDYTFAGWFDYDRNEWDFATTPTEDVTLTAAWDSDLYSAECDADGDATITYYDGPDGVAVDIPAELTVGLDDCTVTALGDSSFWGNDITAVTLPDTLTTIGKDAFYINDITSVNIPDSVTSIGEGAFANNQLTSVTIPDSITVIEDFAFSSNAIESISLPDTVTSIGESSFGTNSLTEVTIPPSVTSIGIYAFNTNLMTSVTFEGAGATVEANAFSLQFGSSQPSYWYTVTTGGTPTTYIPSPVPAPATYTTQPNAFIVTFDSQGGTSIDEQYVIEGDPAVVPAEPFLPGHTFTGWVDGDDAAWDFATLLTEDMTLTATYSANTPTFSVPSSAQPGDTITISGAGFDHAEQVAVELHSTPVALGAVRADSAGNIAGTLVIPVGAEVGDHTIVVISAAGTFTVPFTVLAASDPAPSEPPSPSWTSSPIATDDELASTGSSMNLQAILLAVLVLINAGMALMVVNGRPRA